MSIKKEIEFENEEQFVWLITFKAEGIVYNRAFLKFDDALERALRHSSQLTGREVEKSNVFIDKKQIWENNGDRLPVTIQQIRLI